MDEYDMYDDDMGDKTRGLYEKFFIERTDGSSEPGQKHHGCEYFALDLTHDLYAMVALLAYAKACEAEYPLLAADIYKRFDNVSVKAKP